jgi:response regulator of citrate/malate metabolism
MKKILFCIVVDDEPLAQRVLENYIHRVSELRLVATCESVEEAFEVLQSNQVDILFLDLNLQTNNGMELIQQISKPSDRYYIIISSAISPNQVDLKDIFNRGDILLIDHLTKPFSFDRFMEAIQKIIN